LLKILASLNPQRHKGQQAELQACRFLQQHGLELIDKNYHCRQGEIDLIMKHQDTLVFIEVRYRKNNRFGGAKESVTSNKQHKIRTTALHYMQALTSEPNARFDVIAITGEGKQQTFEWIQNAF